MLTGKNLGKLESVIRINEERYIPVRWRELQALLRSKTAIIQFEGVWIADDLTIQATYSVHPVGEDFKPYMVAAKMSADVISE